MAGWDDISKSTVSSKSAAPAATTSDATAPAAPAAAAPAAPGWNDISKSSTSHSGGGAEAADKPKGYDDTSTAGLIGDTAYRAANTGTLGALDYGLAGLHAIERGTGYDPNATDLATIHKQNEEWQQNHPYLALGADVAGYGVGFGKLGLGARIAGRIGEGIGARVVGSALENAGASAVSEELNTAGQANVGDLIKHAAIAGTVGAATGAVPVKGALKGAESPTKDLGTAAENAFRPLEQTHYNPSDVANSFNSVNLAAKQAGGISDSLDTQVTKISKAISDAQKAGKSVTADDLTNFQIDLNKASQGGRDIGIAKAYEDALDKTMANTRPMYSPLPSTAAISGASDAARAAALKKNVSGDIDQWITDAQRDGPTAVQNDIFKSVNDTPQFYPGGVGDMLRDASQKPGLVSKIAQGATKPALDAAIGGGAEWLMGGNPLLGAAVGGAGGALAGHALSQSRTNALVAKLAQARHANANPGVTTPLSAFKGGIPIPGPLQTYGPNLRGAGVGVSNMFQ
jgi:hypothetical protein